MSRSIIAYSVDRVKHYLSYLRIKPFDTSTNLGRAQERQRRFILTVLSNFAIKGVTLFTTIISIRLTVNYLGAERFGMWALISTFSAMLVFADLGIGNGLLNSISDAYGKNDKTGANQYVTSALYMLLIIASAIALVFTFFYPHIQWSEVFNVSSPEAIEEAGPSIAIFVICTLINLPLGIVQRIQLGYQEGFIHSFWLGIGNILALIALLISIHLEAGLPLLVFALMGAPIFSQLLNGLILFGNKRPWLRPKVKSFSSETAKHILRLGFLFFILQLAVAIGYQSDSFLITQFIGPEAVTQYAIPKRLFSIVITVFGILLTPLWPAYGEAIAGKDANWVKRIFKKSVIYSSVFGTIAAFALLINGKFIIKIWVGSVVSPSTFLLIGLSGWLILNSLINPYAMFMNGANIIRFQVITAVLMTISNILISIYLVQKIGVAGPIWGTIISMAIFVLFPNILYVNRYMNTLGR